MADSAAKRRRETMRGMVGTFLIAALTCGPAASLYAETIPAGMAVIIRLEQSVSSKDARTGQKVAGSVSKDVVVGGKVVIPKGSRATLSVARVQQSGRLKTPAKLWLKIDSIQVKGKKDVVFPAETRLRFVLKTALALD